MMKAKRFPFTERENFIIVQMVGFYGEDWDAISKQLPGRSPKQIHDRYKNYLRQGLRNSPWTESEDEILINMYKAIGPKWSKMMINLPGRSGNDIKNRWHKHLYKKYNGEKNQKVKRNSKLTKNNRSDFNNKTPKNGELNLNQQSVVELSNYNLGDKIINENQILFKNEQINQNIKTKQDSSQQNQVNVKIMDKDELNEKPKKFFDVVDCKNSLFNSNLEIQEIFEEINSQDLDFLWI